MISSTDTLSIANDTLSANADTRYANTYVLPADTDTRSYDTDTLYADTDTLSMLHTEASPNARGLSAVPAPYQLRSDDWVTGTLLVAFIIIVFLINHIRHQLLLQAKTFFYTPQNTETPFFKDITFDSRAVLLMTLLLSLLGGFMTYVYIQHNHDLSECSLSHYILLFIFTGCILLYFLAKTMAYRFIDWVFFNKVQHKIWLSAYSFVISLECLLFFPTVLVFVYFNFSIQHMSIMLLSLLALMKMLLAYKCFSIFFPNFYCLLHFFSYLCALEVVPLIALWQLIVFITGHLIMK